jgi:hypothetical protein
MTPSWSSCPVAIGPCRQKRRSIRGRQRWAGSRKKTGVVVVAGIDAVSTKVKGKGAKGGTPGAELPYFGFIAGQMGSGRIRPRLWRQTSSDSRNACDVPAEAVLGRERVTPISRASVGVVICGELFSPRVRGAFIALRPDFIVDLGHESMGTGVTPNMERLAREAGSAVAHSQHVAEGGKAHLHFVAPGGRRMSVPIADCEHVSDDDFWVAWSMRQF